MHVHEGKDRTVREERKRNLMKEKSVKVLPLLMIRLMMSGVVVTGDWNTTRFYMPKVFDKDFIVFLNFLNRFITKHVGYVLPAIWGVLIVESKCSFELLVLHGCPRRRVNFVGVVVGG